MPIRWPVIARVVLKPVGGMAFDVSFASAQDRNQPYSSRADGTCPETIWTLAANTRMTGCGHGSDAWSWGLTSELSASAAQL